MVLLIVLMVLLFVVIALDIYTLVNDRIWSKRVESGMKTMYKRIKKLEKKQSKNGIGDVDPGMTEAVDPTYIAGWSIGEEGETEKNE